MAMQAPTRITIEVHPPEPGSDWQRPQVRVIPDGVTLSPAQGAAAPPAGTQAAAAVQPREEVPTPPAYEPGPCHCLDDEDCGADHANE